MSAHSDSQTLQSPKSKTVQPKAAPKKSPPVKRQRPPSKKMVPPKKRAKRDVSDEESADDDSNDDEKVKHEMARSSGRCVTRRGSRAFHAPQPKKTKSAHVAKSKKADSSSNSRNNTNTGEVADAIMRHPQKGSSPSSSGSLNNENCALTYSSSCPSLLLAADDSSDDEPLINMIKKAPTDDQLKETVQSLLEEADLKEMTMKKICQRVRLTCNTIGV